MRKDTLAALSFLLWFVIGALGASIFGGAQPLLIIGIAGIISAVLVVTVSISIEAFLLLLILWALSLLVCGVLFESQIALSAGVMMIVGTFATYRQHDKSRSKD